MIERAAIVAAAREWIGTPYVHQASRRGAGADCLGLVRGVWRDLFGREPELPPPYTADWAERQGEETLLLAARRHLEEIDPADRDAGNVLLFRLRGGPAKHCAILSGADRMIHAYDRHGVHECALPDAWRRRIAFAFRFPARSFQEVDHGDARPDAGR
jgi:NlpC/P60 family putative phage cell wall peptidase